MRVIPASEVIAPELEQESALPPPLLVPPPLVETEASDGTAQSEQARHQMAGTALNTSAALAATQLAIEPHGGPSELDLLYPKLEHSTRGDYERGLEEMLAYFPLGDLTKEPNVSDPDARWYIFNEVAICLTGLGRLEQAIPFYQKNIDAGLAVEELTGPRSSYVNLAEVHLHRGDFEAMAQAAKRALELSVKTKAPAWQRDSLVLIGTAADHLGDLDAASAAFAQVDRISRRKNIDPLGDVWAILRAKYLIGNDRVRAAKTQLEAVLSADPAPHVAAQALGVLATIEPEAGHLSRAFELVMPTSSELVKRTLFLGGKPLAEIDAMATDYDDTLARDGKVSASTSGTLDRWRGSGRRALLVSGRPLYDLRSSDVNRRGEHVSPLDPEIERHFDLVVAENGGVIWDPRTDAVTELCPRVPAGLIEALRAVGVPDDRLWAGRTMVSSKIEHLDAILTVLATGRFEMEIALNRDSIMLLPKGVNKASGLEAACRMLGTSAGRTVGFGDAENDLSFLRTCGVAVAVNNAQTAVKQVASVVTPSEAGDGVREILEGVLSQG